MYIKNGDVDCAYKQVMEMFIVQLNKTMSLVNLKFDAKMFDSLSNYFAFTQ